MDHPVTASVLHQILLVEADRGSADPIRAALGRRADLRLHVLGDVVSAIRFLAKRDGFLHAPTPDLILLAARLPYFAGTALLQERRRRPALGGIPVVAYGTDEEERDACLALGADGFLVRPEDPVLWQRTVDRALVHHLPTAAVPP